LYEAIGWCSDSGLSLRVLPVAHTERVVMPKPANVVDHRIVDELEDARRAVDAAHEFAKAILGEHHRIAEKCLVIWGDLDDFLNELEAGRAS
jgi:hypothetical protein